MFTWMSQLESSEHSATWLANELQVQSLFDSKQNLATFPYAQTRRKIPQNCILCSQNKTKGVKQPGSAESAKLCYTPRLFRNYRIKT